MATRRMYNKCRSPIACLWKGFQRTGWHLPRMSIVNQDLLGAVSKGTCGQGGQGQNGKAGADSIESAVEGRERDAQVPEIL